MGRKGWPHEPRVPFDLPRRNPDAAELPDDVAQALEHAQSRLPGVLKGLADAKVQIDERAGDDARPDEDVIDQVAATSDDPDLQDLVAAYRRGEASRVEVLRHPAFRAAGQAMMQATVDRLRESGLLEQVRAVGEAERAEYERDPGAYVRGEAGESDEEN
ncbi:MAG: hypothetical protein ACI379_16960 [Nocardioides sp.]|uniref:hypothetical protein n=1 Tax=Nocardioides sp. TaxID=35761 RepID=UPI003F08BC06